MLGEYRKAETERRLFMKMNRFLASSMGVLMTFGTLTGCSTSGSNSTPPSDKTTKISILNRVNPEVNIDNNPIIAEVGKRLNMEITFDAPPINNYNDKLQIVMASGDLPDIIYNWGGGDANYDKWASNGLLATIDDKIKNYPNLMENISSDMWENVRSTSTHQIHSVPKPNKVNYGDM
jgi:putative aldouronate transport system substrate-binding protein